MVTFWGKYFLFFCLFLFCVFVLFYFFYMSSTNKQILLLTGYGPEQMHMHKSNEVRGAHVTAFSKKKIEVMHFWLFCKVKYVSALKYSVVSEIVLMTPSPAEMR